MTIQIKDIPLFKGLSGAELEEARACLIEKSFKKNETLFLEGSVCERIFIVREGRVKIFRTASSGREQILEALGPGDTCACNAGISKWSCSSSASALTPCRVWYLSREHFARLVQTNQKVSQALMKIFADKLQCFGSLVEEVSLKDSKKRLAKFLLDRLAESGSQGKKSGALEVFFTQEEIAQRLGIARETVARQLSSLKSLGLIGVKTRRIALLDKEGLKKLL